MTRPILGKFSESSKKIEVYVCTKSDTKMFNGNFVCREGRKKERKTKKVNVITFYIKFFFNSKPVNI